MSAAHISESVSKIHCPAVSLPPIITCRPGVPCACPGGCYALKAWCMYEDTREAWSANLHTATTEPAAFFDSIITYLHTRRRPRRFFRWHPSGEVFSQAYANGIMRVARACPTTRFLVYTKQTGIDWRRAPANLTIRYSQWPGMRAHGRGPRAWVADPAQPDRRIPREAYHCPGDCSRCRVCWSPLPNVVFNKH